MSVDMDVWYPFLKSITFKTYFIPLKYREAEAIINFNYYKNKNMKDKFTKEDTKILRNLQKKVDHYFETYDDLKNGAMFRLSGRSGKDMDYYDNKKIFALYQENLEKVSKKFNLQYFNMTYKELLSKDFCTELNKNYFDINYEHNIKVLKYLEENEEICKNSGFDLIKDMTYETLLKKYFNSAQFEDSILQLIDEKESPEYINEYYIRATNYINYYLNPKNKNLMIQINNDNESI